ncbi:hypothetical protein CH275_10310 [Rhodococcus sp. 06-235-1A]|nr:hypothetical protein CH275_10310 [Rhodococcus sp. 06-235-1A]
MRVLTEIGEVMSDDRASRIDPSRLHLLDIENMVSGDVSAVRCSAWWGDYVTDVGVGERDQITVAAAWRHAAPAFFAVPANARRIGVTSAPDAADLALLDSVDVERVAHQHDEVIIASGDHIFAPLARALRAAGVRVVQVVASGVGVSAELYCSCDDLIRLRGSNRVVEARCEHPTIAARRVPRASERSSGVAVLAARMADSRPQLRTTDRAAQ